MSEIIKNEVEEKKEEAIEEKESVSKKSADRGELVLFVPIRARSKDVSVLKYDFSKLTNKEYIEAMSADRGASNPFNMTSVQAFHLFCAAAAHETEDVDAVDILERMSVKDTVIAVQLASVFFAITSRGVSPRTERG